MTMGARAGGVRCERSRTREGEPRKELTEGEWRNELERGGLCRALRSAPTRNPLEAGVSTGVKRPETEAQDDTESDGECLEALGGVEWW